MKKILLIQYTLIFAHSSILPNSITGYVRDATSKEPLIGVNIYVANGPIGTITNNDGRFELNDITSFPINLEISHVGYKTINVQIVEPTLNTMIFLSKEPILFDELIVTASRFEQYQSNTPIISEIINSNDIDNSGSTDIAQLLKLKSGIFVEESMGGQSVLKILGMDSKYIQVLLDGNPINGRFNNRVSLDQIHLNNVDRIEIVKGPSSSLYGSEAMAGVVNIITKKHAAKSISVFGRHDSNFNEDSNNKLQSSDGYFGFDIRQNFKKSNYKINVNRSSLNKDMLNSQNSMNRTGKISYNFGWKYPISSIHSIEFDLTSYSQNDDRKSKLNQTGTHIERNDISLVYKSLNFEHHLRMSKYDRKYLQKRPWNNFVDSRDITKEDLVEYELEFNRKFSSSTLSSGLEIVYANYTSNRIKLGEQLINNISFFSQLDAKHSSKISSSSGIRFDRYSEYETVISPRIASMYKFNNYLKLRLSWGLGFRAPSFIERYIDWDHDQYGYTVMGNPDLKPETSNGSTVSLQYDHSKNFTLSGIYYLTSFKNLIDSYSVSSGVLSYTNFSRANYEGFEINGKFNLSKNFLTSIGLNWLNNRDIDKNLLPNTIPFSVNSTIQLLPLKNLFSFFSNIKIITSYTPQIYDLEKGIFTKGGEKIDTYALINFVGSLSFKNQIKFSAGIDNLADYTNEKYGPFLGRKIYFKISSKIN